MIKAYVSVCDGSTVTIAGKALDSSSSGGEIGANFQTLANDVLAVEVPDLTWNFKVGPASKVSHVSIIVCKDRRTAIAHYTDPVHILKCCACCTKNGSQWCVYGDSGCVCC